MLKLYNKEHVAVSALTDLKDYKIEYLLSGEDQLEFSLSICDENINLIEEEGYVRNKLNEYVIKAMDPTDNFKRFSCVVNVESIKGKSIASFDTSNNNITDTIRLAIAGTGWILADNNITKRRTTRLKNTNALEVLREVRKVFRVDFRYDAINKTIHVYEQFGSDKGVYFSDELNLKSFNIPSDTYDYATRIYPYGKDGLTIASVNGGKDYIDNFQYSNKVIETIWEDNRYTDINSLKADAEAKLEELSKPKRSYQADISDLSKQSEEYNFLDFFIGDTITLLSKQEKFRDKQRIVKYIQYPNNPYSNTCELGNTTLTFEDLQRENEAKNDVVDNITSDNGTLDGSKVDNITTNQISDFKVSVAQITDLTAVNAKISNLEAINVTITGELNSVKGHIGTLTTNIATIDKLTVTHTATINQLKANKADIIQLNAVSAIINTLEAEVGKIGTLVNGNLSSENIQAGGITSDKLTISNGFITNAMIANLDVSKVNAGDISTNKFKIKSDDGGIEIVGATQQFKDSNNRVRIQMGKDTQGNFNFILRGEDGTSTLIDHTGIKSKAIADNLIVNNMIAADAVGEKQINYSSFSSGFNKDTNTSTIKSTKIHLNNQNQSLEVAFNSLKTQADGTKTTTESNSTTIGVMQGQITTAINNTQIVKDGQIISLKDDYNRTVTTVDSMKSTIGSHATQINEATGNITSVKVRVNTVERTLDSISNKLTNTETKIGSIDGKVTATNNKVSSIEQNINSITQRVSSTETKTANIDGQIKSIDQRVSTTEKKTTDKAIIATVKSSQTDDGENTFVQQGDLTLLDNSLTTRFSSSGGYNLIENSTCQSANKIWQTDCEWTKYTGKDWTYQTGLRSCHQFGNYLPDEKYAWTNIFQVIPNTKYTFSCWYYVGGACKGIDIFYLESNKSLEENDYGYDNIQHFMNDNIWSNGKFKRFEHTFITGSNAQSAVIRIDNNGSSNGKYEHIWIGGILLNKGTIALPWSQNPNEMYTGITDVDKDGIVVSMEDGEGVQGNTRVSYEGLTVYDSVGNTNAWFGANDSAYIKELNADIINNPHIIQGRWRNKDWYVGQTESGDGTGRDIYNKSNSIQNVFEYIRETYGCYSRETDINITLDDGMVCTENIYIGGWLGSGLINISFGTNSTFSGGIRAEENTMPVTINGGKTNYNTNDGCIWYRGNDNYNEFGVPLYVRNSQVDVKGFRIHRNANGYGNEFLCAKWGSNVTIYLCDIVGFWSVCRVYNSTVYLIDLRGDIGILSDSISSSIFIVKHKMPIFNSGSGVNQWGSHCDLTDFQEGNNSLWMPKKIQPSDPPQPQPPAPTYKWVEKTCSLTGLKTTTEGGGVMTSGKTGSWGQGSWGSYKSHRGHGYIPSSFTSWCSKSRSVSMYLTMTRENTNHGIIGDVPSPKFKRPNGSYWNSNVKFARGKREIITLPDDIANAIASGSMKKLEMWAGSSKNDYSFYKNVSLKIKCEKEV